MWWKAGECRHSLPDEASNLFAQRSLFDFSHRTKCPQTCLSQWCEGDLNRVEVKVLGGQRKKSYKLVRQIIHKCQLCCRFEGPPFRAPPPPPLPVFRVTESPPFTYTGIDFAGPLFVKGSDGSADQKVWICLYTCCVVRAVHLDLVPNMSTPTFICSLKRFAARRGLPSKIVTDNGKTFKGAAKILKAVMSHDDVQQYLTGVRVDWTFNLERAPWWGGIFERMVRSTKRCLKKMIGQARLTYDELLTAVTEVEVIINSRPLSFISSDDLEEPLTPSHLLIGRRALTLPDNMCYGTEDDDIEVTTNLLNKRMKYISTILDNFWKRWRSEYLLELRDNHRYNSSSDQHSKMITQGDIVVVRDDSKRRGFWKLAKVERTITGRDGKVRGALIRVHGKGKRMIKLQRPLQHLYPLEIRESAVSESHDDIVQQECRRPTRSAAARARELIRTQV